MFLFSQRFLCVGVWKAEVVNVYGAERAIIITGSGQRGGSVASVCARTSPLFSQLCPRDPDIRFQYSKSSMTASTVTRIPKEPYQFNPRMCCCAAYTRFNPLSRALAQTPADDLILASLHFGENTAENEKKYKNLGLIRYVNPMADGLSVHDTQLLMLRNIFISYIAQNV